MGCDIHTHTEAFVNDKWIIAGCVNITYHTNHITEEETPILGMRHPYGGRDYILFGVLAGVRTDGPPLQSLRGVPKDASEYVQQEAEYWDVDGHSKHHYYLNEILDNIQKFEDFDKFLLVIKDMDKLGKRYGLKTNEIRIVFWFDN